jgi:hypothetical protein
LWQQPMSLKDRGPVHNDTPLAKHSRLVEVETPTSKGHACLH